jgi:RNA polymerase sigma-70 factor, ECF subfamily
MDLRALVDAHFDFVWRSLRRLGVEDAMLDDAAQQVWIVASRGENIRVETARSYLFAIAMRVASDMRRSARRRRHVSDEARVAGAADDAPLADERLDRARARVVLDRILDAMPDDLRVVFVLYELEQLTSPEIAEALSIPLGTVSSRLRRAREIFAERARKERR